MLVGVLPVNVFAPAVTPGLFFIAYWPGGHTQVRDERVVEGASSLREVGDPFDADPMPVHPRRGQTLDRLFTIDLISHRQLFPISFQNLKTPEQKSITEDPRLARG